MVRAHTQDHPVDPWVVIFAHSQSRKHVVVQKQKLSLPKNHTFTLEKTLNTLRFEMYRFCNVFFCTIISCELNHTPSPSHTYTLRFLQS